MTLITTKQRIAEEKARHEAALAEGPGWVIVDDAGQRMSDVYLQPQRAAAMKGARWRAKLHSRPMHVVSAAQPEAPAKRHRWPRGATVGWVACLNGCGTERQAVGRTSWRYRGLQVPEGEPTMAGPCNTQICVRREGDV